MRSMGVGGFLIPLVSIARGRDAAAGAALALRPARDSASRRRVMRRLHCRCRTGRPTTSSRGSGRGSRARSCAGPSLYLAAGGDAARRRRDPRVRARADARARRSGSRSTRRRCAASTCSSRRVGPGAVAPAQVLVDARRAGRRRARRRAQRAIGRLVARAAARPRGRRGASTAPTAAASSTERPLRAGDRRRQARVRRRPRRRRFVAPAARRRSIPAAAFPAGVDVLAGGGPPQGVDFLDRAYGVLPLARRSPCSCSPTCC